jgi:hypothetical protein
MPVAFQKKRFRRPAKKREGFGGIYDLSGTGVLILKAFGTIS